MKTATSTLNSRIDSRLAAYAALATAALAAPALPKANATIIYSGPINLNVPSTTSGIYLNVVTGVFSTTPGGAPGWDLNPWSSSGFSIWANNAASVNDGVIAGFAGGSSATLVDNLPLGTLVDGTSPGYVRTGSVESTGATAFTLNSSANYIGFRFLNETTGVINYGWAQFSLSSTLQGQPRTLVSYAYDNSGTGILVGAIPEPSTIALLSVMAVGALGMRAWRGRKTA